MSKRTLRRQAGQLAVVLASAVTLLVGVVVAVPAASAMPKPSGEPLGAWTDTSGMTTPRFGHTATLPARG
ncbi:MAG TPA: hypothetical protein VFA46_14135 [Actinomycetes bacterium]|jgi:hypothetical protein|nr:hypothetical protein [Actinomycetes bacterium]